MELRRAMGVRFLSAAAALDLEGVVGKYAAGVYQSGGKVKNPAYSQVVGRREPFDARRDRAAVRRSVAPRLLLA